MASCCRRFCRYEFVIHLPPPDDWRQAYIYPIGRTLREARQQALNFYLEEGETLGECIDVYEIEGWHVAVLETGQIDLH